MKSLLRGTMFSVLIALGTTAYAQEPGQSTPPPQQRDDAQNVSLVGCLTKGTPANQYLITDQKSGEKVAFAASARLDKFVNQTVKLTGKVVARQGEKVFQPESVEPVSSSCEGTQKQ